eukprot:gene15536-biopygen1134
MTRDAVPFCAIRAAYARRAARAFRADDARHDRGRDGGHDITIHYTYAYKNGTASRVIVWRGPAARRRDMITTPNASTSAEHRIRFNFADRSVLSNSDLVGQLDVSSENIHEPRVRAWSGRHSECITGP